MTANQRKPTTSKDKDILATSKSKAVAKKTALVLRYIIPPLSLGLSRLYLPKPPAPHLFKSNTPPSDHEVNLIFAAITLAAQKQERIISTKCNRHTVHGHQLEWIRVFITCYRAIMSSIRRLPAEVLQHTFGYLIPPQPLSFAVDPRRAVSQVCCFWRTSAISSSSLWGVLPIVHLSKSRLRTGDTDVWRELLFRSGNSPLTVDIRRNKSTEWDIDDNNHALVVLLTSHSRWKNLSFTATPATVMQFNNIRKQLPNLENLNLFLTEDFYRANSRIDTFEVAPRLREVKIMCPPYLGDIVLPYVQLEKIEAALEELSIQNVSGLRVCQTLSSLISRSSGPCCLRKLFLSDAGHDLSGDLATLLSLTPALETLNARILFSGDIAAPASSELNQTLVPNLTHCSLWLLLGSEMQRVISRFALSRCQPFHGDPNLQGPVQIKMLRIHM